MPATAAAAAIGLTVDPKDDATGSAPEDPGADLIERVVDSRVLHRGRYLTFRIDTIERPDGTRATRDVAAHPGAVRSSRVDPEDHVLLVRQYRSPAERVLLEIPAGTLDPRPDGSIEDPDLAARRELEEETGSRAGVVAAARPVLDRARVHVRADAPVPRDRAVAGRDDRLAPDEDERLRAGADAVARTPWRPPNAARSRTRSRSSGCSGWRGSAIIVAARHGRSWPNSHGRARGVSPGIRPDFVGQIPTT